MRALLIDPIARTVKHVETSGTMFDKGGLPGLLTLLECKEVTAVDLPLPSEVLYLDYEGLLKPNYYFQIFAANQPFAGRGLILGLDKGKALTDTDFSPPHFFKLVTFYGGPLPAPPTLN
jgi:hypothetical protein